MKVITCFKWVMDEADISIDQKSKTLNFDRVSYKISDYDLNAIEEAVQVAEKVGGSTAGLTIGTPEVRNGLKNALARGLDTVYYVTDDQLVDLESSQISKILAKVLKEKVEFDLIICGEGSSDSYDQQVGARLSEILNIPCLTYINKITLEDDKHILAERKIDDGLEVVRAELPLLITVLPSINQPRIPSLKQVLAASKKPVQQVTLGELNLTKDDYKCGLVTKGVQAAITDRKRLKFEGDTESIRQILGQLQKDGVI